MIEQLLTDIGFTRSEIAVYLALLELGPSRSGPIIKEAKIASGKIYLILEKLINKGLVTYTIVSGIKQFQAKDPERLLDYLKEKEQEFKKQQAELKKALPKLRAQYREYKNLSMSEVYEGINGLKTFYNWALNKMSKGDTIRIMGVSRKSNDRFEPFFLDWNKRRVKKGIKMKIIFNHDCRDYGKVRKKMKFTRVRYFPKNLENPISIDIFKDYVVNVNVEKTPVCFLIKNKETAFSYKQYFNDMWKRAKK